MKILEDFFKKLNSNVKYCHFKSNQHLNASFLGKTDFDLLIHKDSIYTFQNVLFQFGFKRRISTANKQYYGMEDYIGCDPISARLIHIHAHYQLIFGGSRRKNYVIDQEEIIWNNIRFNEEFNLYTVNPEFELILLILRTSLKIKFNSKNMIKLLLGREIIPLELLNEYDYLQAKVDSSKFLTIIECLSVDFSSVQKVKFLFANHQINSFSFFVNRFRIIESLSDYSIHSKKELRLAETVRKLALTNSRSYFSSVGMRIAFVGCDGSGKSSIADDIRKWLAWKLSVEAIYMGMQKKKVSRRKLYNILNRVILHTVFASKYREYIHLTNAKAREANYRKSRKFARSGAIVLFDRYPFKEFWDMEQPMDGPRIRKNSKKKKYERSLYSKIGQPDLVFVLNVSIENSMARKSNQGISQNETLIKSKVKAIQRLISEKSDNSKYICIDANKPYDEVILKIKKSIWERI